MSSANKPVRIKMELPSDDEDESKPTVQSGTASSSFRYQPVKQEQFDESESKPTLHPGTSTISFTRKSSIADQVYQHLKAYPESKARDAHRQLVSLYGVKYVSYSTVATLYKKFKRNDFSSLSRDPIQPDSSFVNFQLPETEDNSSAHSDVSCHSCCECNSSLHSSLPLHELNSNEFSSDFNSSIYSLGNREIPQTFTFSNYGASSFPRPGSGKPRDMSVIKSFCCQPVKQEQFDEFISQTIAQSNTASISYVPPVKRKKVQVKQEE